MTYKNSLTHFNSLVETLGQIPTIGKKSAQKLAFTLAVENQFLALKLSHLLESSARFITTCEICGAVSENEICEICFDVSRDNGELCVVLHAKDIFTIEEMGEFGGKYWVIKGELEKLDFDKLKERIKKDSIKEIIFAFSPSLANEAVMIFIEDKLSGLDLHFSKIAQGVPTGIGLENIDQLSLSRALIDRVRF